LSPPPEAGSEHFSPPRGVFDPQHLRPAAIALSVRRVGSGSLQVGDAGRCRVHGRQLQFLRPRGSPAFLSPARDRRFCWSLLEQAMLSAVPARRPCVQTGGGQPGAGRNSPLPRSPLREAARGGGEGARGTLPTPPPVTPTRMKLMRNNRSLCRAASEPPFSRGNNAQTVLGPLCEARPPAARCSHRNLGVRAGGCGRLGEAGRTLRTAVALRKAPRPRLRDEKSGQGALSCFARENYIQRLSVRFVTRGSPRIRRSSWCLGCQPRHRKSSVIARVRFQVKTHQRQPLPPLPAVVGALAFQLHPTAAGMG